ncbi:MAG: MCP four helix bundle domain-containing protein [Nitrospiraceae bacterium]
MALRERFSVRELGWSRIVLSLLILGLGWVGGRELGAIDSDLRVMYTEYTLGATDLAHIMADTVRYRNTILRALEAEDRKDFERITASLPELRAKIQHGIDRYSAASLRVSRSGRSEPEDLQAVRLSLDDYFHSANKTIDLLVQEYTAPSKAEATEFRRRAETHAAENAGPKMIQLSIALDRLLETIADVAKDMRDEGSKTIRTTSLLLFFGSLFLATLNIFMGVKRTNPPAAEKQWRTDMPTAHSRG